MTEPQTGAIRVTDEPATLPADAAQSELCPTICLVCSDAEVTDDESSVAGQEEEDTQHGSVASVLAAKAETFRYAALGPRGTPPVPDPRVLEWAIPAHCEKQGAPNHIRPEACERHARETVTQVDGQ